MSVQSSGNESTICWKVSASPAMRRAAYPADVWTQRPSRSPEAISDGMSHDEPALDSDDMAATDVSGPELEAVAHGCALVDRSERGKLALTGSQAAEFLNGQVTNDVEALAPDEGLYAAFLTPKGKMLGDLRVLRTAS